MEEAKREIMKNEVKKANERRKGELAALDISRSLKELRAQCVNDNAFAVKESLEILKNKIKDEKSLEYFENIEKMLETFYENPFRKLEDPSDKGAGIVQLIWNIFQKNG